MNAADARRQTDPGTANWTLRGPGTRSGAAWIVSAPREVQAAFLDELTPAEVRALPWLWEFWALPHQVPPEGGWRSWVILGGRGAGKTRAGAEWVRMQVEGARPGDPGRASRVALVGETYDQAREVMVMGDSGILACSPPDRKPVWEAGRRRLVWPNGAVAVVCSAHDPEALRGPQFDAAWVDELAKWPRAEEAWQMLQFALRLGADPRQVVTTTPRNVGVLKALLAQPSTVVTRAATADNRAFLAPSFLREVYREHGGTRLGAQELDGVLVEDVAGALWTSSRLDGLRVETAGDLDRVVVGVDPAVSGAGRGDDCGIVVVGAVTRGDPSEWRAVVLEDASVSGGGPADWARAVVAARDRHGASRVVAEVNQGGALVEAMIRGVDPLVPYRAVRAVTGKAARAEPVAALYEQGRVRHLRGLQRLEDQMGRMTAQGFTGAGSPDRVDALVWAVTDLILEPARAFRRPRVRSL